MEVWPVSVLPLKPSALREFLIDRGSKKGKVVDYCLPDLVEADLCICV